MRVRGDLPPSNAFTLEQQPKKPGYILARFFENVAPFEETIESLTIRGYEYDEYQLELIDTGDLQADILNRYDYYMGTAQLQDTQPRDGDETEVLKEHVADLTLALEIMLGVYDDELKLISKRSTGRRSRPSYEHLAVEFRRRILQQEQKPEAFDAAE